MEIKEGGVRKGYEGVRSQLMHSERIKSVIEPLPAVIWRRGSKKRRSRRRKNKTVNQKRFAYHEYVFGALDCECHDHAHDTVRRASVNTSPEEEEEEPSYTA